MRILAPLQHRALRLLWGGQVFSAVGDELYQVALVWTAASLIGNDTGYVMALQAAASLTVSLFGGHWADRWDHRRTMVAVDILRGIAVLALPVVATLGHLSVAVLIPVTLIVASTNALFQPALRACIPRLASDPSLLLSTNALMETTSRLAKILGPGVVGLLGRLVPVVHYFTLDAFSFFVSAWSLNSLRKDLPSETSTLTRSPLKSSLLAGLRLSKSRPLIHFILMTDAVVNSAWLFIFPMAVGMLLHERMPENISALGMIVGAYGVGNLGANIVLGNMKITQFARLLFMGRIIAGVGFIGLANSNNFTWMMVFSGIAATAGPITDLSKNILIQREYSSREIAQVYRFSMSVVYAALLIVLLVSPSLMKLFTVTSLISVAACMIAAMGLLGLTTTANGTS